MAITSRLLRHIPVLVMNVLIVCYVSVAAASEISSESSYEPDRIGRVTGRVVDVDTEHPLLGVSVQLHGTQRGAVTDAEGRFEIKDVPIGTIALQFSFMGYTSVTRTDIVIRPGRTATVIVGLTVTYLRGNDLEVSAGYFSELDNKPVSTINFSGEEIRRAPGTAGDVSRIVSSLPSIAKVNDQLNSLVVRGGSPSENAFYIDNILIPNINHYPLQGSTGGPIGLINVDFIQEVDFSAGGFNASYGDYLSSVMELSFREGNREESAFQVDFHLAGAGLIAEGPLGSGRGSWMISFRKSILDFIADAVDAGFAPSYSDYQGKVTYDLSSRHKLSLLGIAGVDYVEFGQDRSYDDGGAFYGETDGHEFVAGLNWEYSWGADGYSSTSLSYLGTRYGNLYYAAGSDQVTFDENTRESKIQLRNTNVLRFNKSLSAEFGAEGCYLIGDYHYFETNYINQYGKWIPSLTVSTTVETPRLAGFASLKFHLIDRIEMTIGGRFSYYKYSGRSHLAPRASLEYHLNQRSRIIAAIGIYHQPLPMFLRVLRDEFRQLKDLQSYHYVLGFNHILWDDTRLSLEAYFKDYFNFPLDPKQPGGFALDDMNYYGYRRNFESLFDDGRARSYGIELIIQKRLVRGIYGLVSASFSRSEYRAGDGLWRNRVYDNGMIFGIEGGYKPNHNWELALRWIYAGGAPYTPFNLQHSREFNEGIYDLDQINELRQPDYHSLNLRVDRRYYFSGSNLGIYLSVWNAYNRKNVAFYYWNKVTGGQDTMYQWTVLPLIGIEYEF